MMWNDIIKRSLLLLNSDIRSLCEKFGSKIIRKHNNYTIIINDMYSIQMLRNTGDNISSITLNDNIMKLCMNNTRQIDISGNNIITIGDLSGELLIPDNIIEIYNTLTYISDKDFLHEFFGEKIDDILFYGFSIVITHKNNISTLHDVLTKIL